MNKNIFFTPTKENLTTEILKIRKIRITHNLSAKRKPHLTCLDTFPFVSFFPYHAHFICLFVSLFQKQPHSAGWAPTCSDLPVSAFCVLGLNHMPTHPPIMYILKNYLTYEYNMHIT